MKHTLFILTGLLVLLFAALCSFPTVLAIPGIAWRVVIGLSGCFLLVSGIRKAARKG